LADKPQHACPQSKGISAYSARLRRYDTDRHSFLKSIGIFKSTGCRIERYRQPLFYVSSRLCFKKIFDPCSGFQGEGKSGIRNVPGQITEAACFSENQQLISKAHTVLAHEKVHSDKDALMQGECSIQ
jgi:hypothetical protein